MAAVEEGGAVATSGRRGRRGERRRRRVWWWKGPASGWAVARAGADPVGEGPARGPATPWGDPDGDAAAATLPPPDLGQERREDVKREGVIRPTRHC